MIPTVRTRYDKDCNKNHHHKNEKTIVSLKTNKKYKPMILPK